MASKTANLFLVAVALLVAVGLLGCPSSGGGSGGCQTASECQGDPGAGCTWACIDGACETLCTEECAVAADCEALTWSLDCEGHWECRDHACEAICDGQGCQGAADCDGLPWELQCPGHWECEAGDCVGICDQETCAQPSDCWELSLPCQYGGEWDCQAGDCEPICADQCQGAADCQDLQLPCPDGGHWLCEAGECVAECDPPPECAAAQDCLDLPWMVDCDGHWACEQRRCVEVCDFEACPDGYCDAQRGESAASCPADCDLACQTAADCADLFWGVDCEGHWECNADGLCEPVCDGGCIPEGLPEVMQRQCCPGLEPVEDCLPGHACPGALRYCVDCRDGVCEPHENQFNCPGDCPEGCPEGEQAFFQCPDGEAVPWCVCKADPCQPMCVWENNGSGGWMDPCTDQILVPGDCRNCELACLYVGDFEREGWYAVCEQSGQDAIPVALGACMPFWECNLGAPEQCL